MQPATPLCCWQCGTVLSAAGGRCPACGIEQNNAPSPPASLAAQGGFAGAPIERRARPAPERTPRESGSKKALPWVVLGVGLAGIGLLGFLFAPRGDKAASTEPSAVRVPAVLPEQPPRDPNDLGVRDPSSVDPTDLLGKAKTRALAWNRDAVLVSMHAEPVVLGRVDVTAGGSVEYLFGKPTGEGFGPGAKVGGKRLRIVLSDGKTQIEEASGAPKRAALEPNCQLDEAARKAQAAGSPPTTPLSVTYEVSEKHGKGVWRISAVGDDAHARTLDGWTCAILVR